jgi:cell division protein FtsB
MMLLEAARATLMRHRSRIAIIMLVLIWGYFLVAFGEQAWRARQLQEDVDAQRESIAALARENTRLQTQADLYASDAYIDYVQGIARRDLNLANPGETVILVRWQQPPGSLDAEELSTEPPEPERPNWKRWLDAFSGS